MVQGHLALRPLAPAPIGGKEAVHNDPLPGAVRMNSSVGAPARQELQALRLSCLERQLQRDLTRAWAPGCVQWVLPANGSAAQGVIRRPATVTEFRGGCAEK
jgi:hypothetical protein